MMTKHVKPFCRSYHRIRGVHVRAHANSVTNLQRAVASACGWPIGQYDGSGQSIAYIELGGGYTPSDAQSFFLAIGLPVPNIQVQTVAGGSNTPDGPNGADGEVALDYQCGGAIAPKATHYIIFAPNTSAGFVAAIRQAVSLNVTAISISWGGPENTWSASDRAAMDAAFQSAQAAGISVFAAAGDNGSGDGESGNNVDYPASSPYVTACGGTTLRIGANGQRQSETVWNDGSQGGATGGGFSAVYIRPSWQSGNSNSQRLVPDCAGNADPQTGYPIVVDGQSMVIGGTSAWAPMMAGLCCLLVQATGKRLGLLNPSFYANLPDFFDVVSGSNGTYSAMPGIDPCTGCGVPQAGILQAVGAGGSSPPPPPPIQQPPVQPPPIQQPPKPTVPPFIVEEQVVFTLLRLHVRPIVIASYLPMIIADANAGMTAQQILQSLGVHGTTA